MYTVQYYKFNECGWKRYLYGRSDAPRDRTYEQTLYHTHDSCVDAAGCASKDINRLIKLIKNQKDF